MAGYLFLASVILMISVRGIIRAYLVRGVRLARVARNDNPRCAEPELAISQDARIIYILRAMKQRRWVAGVGGTISRP